MFKPVLTEEDKEDIREARKEGKSYNAISKMIDASRGTITRFCILEGIAVDVSEKVIKANQIKGKLFEKKKEICPVCGKLYKPRYDATIPGCTIKCVGIYRSKEKECPECGKRYIKNNRRYKPYCSEECYYAHRIRVCIDCGRSFTNEVIKARCDECQREYDLQVHKDYYYQHAEENNQKKREEYIPIPKDDRRVCLVCGGVYYTTVNNSSKRHCSTRCARYMASQRRRARLRNAFVEDVFYGIIYKRDKGICYICLRKVHKRWNPYDKLSGTMDHVVALDNEGEHSYRNIKLACLYCNSKKSNNKTWLQQELGGMVAGL